MSWISSIVNLLVMASPVGSCFLSGSFGESRAASRHLLLGHLDQVYSRCPEMML